MAYRITESLGAGIMTTKTTNTSELLARWQQEQSEFFSPGICEIVGEYAAWREKQIESLIAAIQAAEEHLYNGRANDALDKLRATLSRTKGEEA